MASPQKENGFTAIANEIFEALCLRKIRGESRAVFDFILRKTYGYQKKEDILSLSQIATATGLARQHVCRALNHLKQVRMIERDAKGKTRPLKDYEAWVVPKRGLPKLAIGITKLGSPPSPEIGSYKRKGIKKERNLSKDKSVSAQVPETMNEDIDRSFPRKRLYGDEQINWFLDYWDFKFPQGFVEAEKWARIFVKHLKGKIGAKRLREVIEWASDPDCWWFSRLTGFKQLYYKRDTVLKNMETSAEDKEKAKKPHFDGDTMYRDKKGRWMIIPRSGGDHLIFNGNEKEIYYA